MADHGLAADYIEPCTTTDESIRAATERMLERYPAMTAIICRDDTVAQGVLKVLHEKGIAVPERMTVTGFGDVSGASEESVLTTVQIDAHTMGMLAVNVIMNRLRVPAMMPITSVIHAPLCIRATSGPPRLGVI
jgi:DNA-binding LacI/PurR family transcriptional regulator